LFETELHLPPAFSQSACVVSCAIVSVDEPETPEGGLADGGPLLSVLELLDGADAPGPVLVPDEPLDVPLVAPLVESVLEPVLELLPVPLVPELPAAPPVPLEPVPAAPAEPAAPEPPLPPEPPPV